MTTVVITGANRGIGLALAKVYLGKGDEVYAVCRKASAELKKTKAKVIEGIDVTKPDCLAVLQDALSQVNIDILINNAGILRDETFGQLDFESILEQFHVNTLSPLKVTETLKKNMSAGAKVALITSRMGSIADNTSGGRYGYRMSKAALNAAGKSLAHDLKFDKIAVAILHPGFVQTDMVDHYGEISADTAAERLMKRISDLTLHTTGTFWHSDGQILPW